MAHGLEDGDLAAYALDLRGLAYAVLVHDFDGDWVGGGFVQAEFYFAEHALAEGATYGSGGGVRS